MKSNILFFVFIYYMIFAFSFLYLNLVFFFFFIADFFFFFIHLSDIDLTVAQGLINRLEKEGYVKAPPKGRGYFFCYNDYYNPCICLG